MSDATCRLAIGTAQFGLDYGISNRRGKVGKAEVGAILTLARDRGVDTLDTAIAYGDAEERLGESGLNGWRVVTKLPEVPLECPDIPSWVAGAIAGSLGRLGIGCLHAVLFHRPEQLLRPGGAQLFAAVEGLREEGLIRRIGVSIYDPGKLESLLRQFPIDLVQAPFSVVDRRLEHSGWMKRLAELHIEVHVRSVFLQGLLLMGARSWPASFNRWQPLWAAWHEWLEEHGLTAVEACLRFVLSYGEVSRVVVGVETANQLAGLLDAAAGAALEVPGALASGDIELINPSTW